MGTSVLFLAQLLILGAAIVFVVPFIFFLMVAVIGRKISLEVHRDSWLATTNVSFIRRLSKRFLI